MRLVSLLSKITLLPTITAVIAVALPSANEQEARSSLTLPGSATDIVTTNAVNVPNPNSNMTDFDALAQPATSSTYGSCGLLRMDDGIYYDLIGDGTCQESPRPISGSVIIDSGCTCIFYRLAPYCLPASAFMWVDGPIRRRIDGEWMSEWYWCAHVYGK